MHPRANKSKSKLITFELKQILFLGSLSQNDNNIHPITQAGNLEITADTFFSLISSYLVHSFFLSHLFMSTTTLSPQHTLPSYHHQPSSKASYSSLSALSNLLSILQLSMSSSTCKSYHFFLPTHTIPLNKTLQYLPIAFRVKSKTFNMVSKALQSLAPTYCSDLMSSSSCTPGSRPYAPTGLPQSLYTRCSHHLDHSTPSVAFPFSPLKFS